jgi:Recombinase
VIDIETGRASDPEYPRRIPVVDAGEAETVRRVFASILAGKSPRTIADELNRADLPAPHDGGKGHKGVRSGRSARPSSVTCETC